MARSLQAAPAMAVLAAFAAAVSLGGCARNPYGMQVSLSERECMARVMYFESNRSSEDGMLAVGTVVMNRLQSSRYPKTICGVVGQQNQFADGALSKPAGGRSLERALRVADAVIAGERHDNVGGAMFFHTAGYTFPYRNMAYVAAAGGNVFYEKRTPGTFQPVAPHTLVARAEPGRQPEPTRQPKPETRRYAAAEPDDDEEAPRRRAPDRPARYSVDRSPDEPRPMRGRPERAIDDPQPRRLPDRPARRDQDRYADASPDEPRLARGRPMPSIGELIELDLERPKRGR